MTRFGFTLMTEQNGPRELVDAAVRAEEVGFDLLVSSDHYSPWLTEQGHAPYAWTVLGAVAHATSRVDLMTYVTCPTMRYHPAVVAQKAATLQILAEGRFTLGLGSGENLNEHVVGDGLARHRDPAGHARSRRSRSSASCTPASSSPSAVSTSTSTRPGSGTCPSRASTSPWPSAATGASRSSRRSPTTSSRCSPRRSSSTAGTPCRTTPIGPGRGPSARSRSAGTPSEEAAVQRAHEQFRWFGGGWKVNADLPTPMGFAGASQFVRPEDVAESIPCGPDLDAVVEAVRPWWEAGFTDVALVQVGGEHQQAFLDEAAGPAAREAAPGRAVA